MMLDGTSNDVVPVRLPGVSYALYGKVICLSPTAGKDNLLAPSTDKGSNFVPRRFYSSLCLLPKGVNAGGVAKTVIKIWQHRRYHLGMCWRSSSMVKIYPSHLTLHNISDDRINPHPLGSYPGNPLLDISLIPL